MSFLDNLRKIAAAPAAPRAAFAPQVPAAVTDTDDVGRVLALPRRPVPSLDEQTEMARVMTLRLRRDRTGLGPCECARLRPEVVARGQSPCITELRPVQGWYLTEAAEVGGALGFIQVGGGKTGIDILTAMVLPPTGKVDAKGSPVPPYVVVLIPPGLRAQFALDYKVWAQHFEVPNMVGGPRPYVTGRARIEVFAYSELSQAKNSTWLKTRNPDAVLGDEVSKIRDRNSTRTGRFLGFFVEKENQGQRAGYFAHDGSMTTKSIEDYCHHAVLALGEKSPTPLDPGTAGEWAEAINPQNVLGLSVPGALKRLCAAGENLRAAWQRRLTETKGVIVASDSQLGTRLTFSVREPPPMPTEVAAALSDVRRLAQRPDGEELLDALQVAACARQVAAGMYLYWAYPRGEAPEVIEDWFKKRKAWGSELREMLKHRADHLDSPALLQAAAERYRARYKGALPTWQSGAWAPWREVRDLVQPVTRVQWISDWLARDAAEWGQTMEDQGRPGIIWTDNSAVGHMVAELGAFKYYGAGPQAAEGILGELGNRTIVASIKAHGVGRNLQSFSTMLFVQLPSDAGAYEQAIGREHRPGQPRDEVHAAFYQHVPEYVEALDKATEFSRYVTETTGAQMKLLYGVWVGGKPTANSSPGS